MEHETKEGKVLTLKALTSNKAKLPDEERQLNNPSNSHQTQRTGHERKHGTQEGRRRFKTQREERRQLHTGEYMS